MLTKKNSQINSTYVLVFLYLLNDLKKIINLPSFANYIDLYIVFKYKLMAD